MWEEIWRFETARFVILGEAAPEDMEWDGEGEGPAYGDAWFTARIRVALREDESETLGESMLGGCWYRRAEDFFRVESWTKQEREAMREIRRALGHVQYLAKNRPRLRGQIARELARVAELRRDVMSWRESTRRGVILGAYFADMVREAIAEARREVARRGEIAATMRAA